MGPPSTLPIAGSIAPKRRAHPNRRAMACASRSEVRAGRERFGQPQRFLWLGRVGGCFWARGRRSAPMLRDESPGQTLDDAPIPWLAIAGVMATVSVFAIAQGLAYPLLSFILKARGTSSTLIGLSAAMTPCGLIASAPLISILSRRFGERATALTCAIVAGLLFAAIGWARDIILWFPLRFLLGSVVGP